MKELYNVIKSSPQQRALAVKNFVSRVKSEKLVAFHHAAEPEDCLTYVFDHIAVLVLFS